MLLSRVFSTRWNYCFVNTQIFLQLKRLKKPFIHYLAEQADFGGASEMPLFMLSSMDTSPSPAQTSFPSLYATRSDIANSCFRLRLLTVPKQKGYEYVKRKFEPEAEQKQQEQAKLSQIFCTKGTSELQEKNILQIMIETKARLQLMVRDIETIKDGKSYGSMEVSKTEESNLIFLNQFYLNIGVKMHRSCLDCTRLCTIVFFRVLFQNNVV